MLKSGPVLSSPQRMRASGIIRCLRWTPRQCLRWTPRQRPRWVHVGSIVGCHVGCIVVGVVGRHIRIATTTPKSMPTETDSEFTVCSFRCPTTRARTVMNTNWGGHAVITRECTAVLPRTRCECLKVTRAQVVSTSLSYRGQVVIASLSCSGQVLTSRKSGLHSQCKSPN